MAKRGPRSYRLRREQVTPLFDCEIVGGRNAEALRVPGRTCGDCSLCCNIPAVREQDVPDNPELAKGMCKDCSQLSAGRCTIYEDRPRLCREYYCGFMMGIALDRPDRIGVVWTPKFEDTTRAFQMSGLCRSVEKAINDKRVAMQVNGFAYWNTLNLGIPLGAVILQSPKHQLYFDLTGASAVGHVRDVDPADPYNNEGLKETQRAIRIPWFVNPINQKTAK